ncbi:MAG: phosphatase PAP2 family protein [Candidatus Binatia bacterium]
MYALSRMLVAGVACFLAFAVITWGVVARDTALTRFDDRLMAALARRRSPTIDGVAAPLSMLATLEPLTVQGMVAGVMLAATVGRSGLLHFAIVSIGSGALSEIVKRLVRRPRPPGPHVIPWIRGFAYPSGDLLTAAAIYLTIVLIAAPHLADATARALAFAIVAGVLALLGACRVYVGVHHPSDVVGGACLGAGWALFVADWLG